LFVQFIFERSRKMPQQESKLARSSLNIITEKGDGKSKENDISRSFKEREKLKPVVSTPATKHKKTLGEKFKEAFIGSDNRSVGDYIVHDVLVPALKSLINDMVSGGVEMILFGERTRRPSNVTRDRGRSYVSYNSAYTSTAPQNRATSSRYQFEDIIFGSRGEAETVLSHLVDLTIEYGMASVGDLHELASLTPNFTDYNYGWTNLRDACTERTRNGYILRLPSPRPL